MKALLCLVLLLPLTSRALECSFRSHEELGRMVLARVQNLRCSTKKIHLTFDDGPHPQYTPMILEELRLRNVKATFFVSTTNIAPDHVAQRNIVKAEMDAGHAIGSHGHEHEAYDIRMGAGNEVLHSLSPDEKLKQIRLSTRYLNEATGNRFGRQRPLLYRFPYGRGALPSDAELDEMERRGEMHFSSRDRTMRLREYRSLSAPLHAIAGAGYGHLLWNHDSNDSTANAPQPNDPNAKANFISQNLINLCGSPNTDIVSLFHDIKPFNPEVVAVLIDLGKCLGMNFVDQKTILQSSALTNAGTYISKESVTAAPVRRLDEIGKLLESLGPDCEEEKRPAGSCYSQDANRTFRDCESGEVSICIRGSWFKKTEEKLHECRARGL